MRRQRPPGLLTRWSRPRARSRPRSCSSPSATAGLTEALRYDLDADRAPLPRHPLRHPAGRPGGLAAQRRRPRAQAAGADARGASSAPADGPGHARVRRQRPRLAEPAAAQRPLARRGDQHGGGTGTPSRGCSRRQGSRTMRSRSSSTASTAACRATRTTRTGAASVADAARPEVLLAYEMNGRLPEPQHGSPLRLVVPGWYGMTSVKWLTSIEAVRALRGLPAGRRLPLPAGCRRPR